MTVEEKRYHQMTTHVGIAAIAFLALLFLRNRALELVAAIMAGGSMQAYLVAYHLVGGILYAAMFCLPVLLFCLLRPKGERFLPRLEWQLPRDTLLYVFFGMAVVIAAAYLNNMMLSVFDLIFPPVEPPIVEEGLGLSNYELVLMLFTTAVVPAFAEEFFFRAMVLESFRPYGRTTAILASALLFGLMHQSFEQIFYTIVAGIVIGWVYVCTDSIWPCVLLHFVNNFTSVITSAFSARLPNATYVTLTYTVDGVIFLVGLACGALLLLRKRSKGPDPRVVGAFEQELEPCEEYAPVAIAPGRRLQLFFSVPIIIYTVVCIVTMLGLFTYL